MRIPVVGFDPSIRNWGMAASTLCLATGVLDDPVLSLIRVQGQSGKQVRQNSTDLHLAEQLSRGALAQARQAKVVFVEVPIGSQSSRAMASYGICIGVLGTIRAEGIPLVEVTPPEVKETFTGNRNATKEMMVNKALSLYPSSNFPTHAGKVSYNKAEHLADAIAAIHAGVHTPMFQNLMRLLKEV